MPEPIWQADTLIHYPLIEHVDIAADGRVLYTVRRPYLTDEASEFRRTLYLASPGAAPRALTGVEDASQPRWSPDGMWIAFLRPTKPTGKPGLWIMPAHGGEPWPITGKENGIRGAVTRFAWRPDSRSIAFTSVPWDEEQEAKRKRREDVRHWRVDEDFAHLYQLTLPETPAAQMDALPRVRRLTEGRLHVTAFDWQPDGRALAFTHQPTPYLETWPKMRLATVAVEPDGNGVPPLVDRGEIGATDPNPTYSPDGAWIACQVSDDARPWQWRERVHLFPADGGDPQALAQVSDENPLIVGWSPDSSSVYVKNERGIVSELLALPVDGGDPRPLIAPNRLISVAHLNRSGQAALVMEDFTEPQSVYLADLAAGSAPQQIARPQSPTYPQGPLPQVRLLQWQTPDGLTIEGILYLPADYDAARDGKLPLLLHVHGGPAGVFQRQFAGHPYYYTPAALVERGVALLRCNPRGSGGYGAAFRQANLRDWGGGDFRDLMQGVDTVIEQGIADPDRLGICGWSYGGFMTSWTITQTDRFRAASIGAAVTNLVSFVGTSDIPSFIPDYFRAEPWQDPELYHARSPLYQAHRVKTPALIQHGDADARVPLEQGLQYYTALERCGVPVNLYIYPRQGHAIDEPRLLADAIRRNLEWFTAHLAQAHP